MNPVSHSSITFFEHLELRGGLSMIAFRAWVRTKWHGQWCAQSRYGHIMIYRNWSKSGVFSIFLNLLVWMVYYLWLFSLSHLLSAVDACDIALLFLFSLCWIILESYFPPYFSWALPIQYMRGREVNQGSFDILLSWNLYKAREASPGLIRLNLSTHLDGVGLFFFWVALGLRSKVHFQWTHLILKLNCR